MLSVVHNSAGTWSDMTESQLAAPNEAVAVHKRGEVIPVADGTSEAQYAGHEAWSNRKWAWEFLRRNVQFREACDALGESSGKHEQELICERFGITWFRDYRDRVKGRFPSFVPGSISSWSKIDGPKYTLVGLPTQLKPGEVLIRFNLLPALSNARALTAQLERAKSRLESRLKYLADASGKPLVVEKPKRDNFLVAIRMSDAKDAGMSRAAIARMLFPDVVKGASNAEAADYFKSRYRSARELIDTGYLAVATSSTRAR